MATTYDVSFVTLHGHRRAFVKTGSGPVLLLLHGLGTRPHHLGAGHRATGRAPHRDRPRPARARAVGQAARRLQRRRLRQRHARPVDSARHRQGHGGRAQLRRRGRDAVRLPVPRAHPPGDPRVLGRAGPGRDARDQGDHDARLPPVHGRADPPRTPAPDHHDDAPDVALEAPAHPRPGRDGRHRRDVPRPAGPGRHPPRGPRRRRLERPDRDHVGPGLPHQRDADAPHLGSRRHGDPAGTPGQRACFGARTARRGDARRGTLPAQGAPGPVRRDRLRLHGDHRAGGLQPRPLPGDAEGGSASRGRAGRGRPGAGRPDARGHRPGPDQASPPSCFTPETAVGSSIWYFSNAAATASRGIEPASARACNACTTTDCASTWK